MDRKKGGRGVRGWKDEKKWERGRRKWKEWKEVRKEDGEEKGLWMKEWRKGK